MSYMTLTKSICNEAAQAQISLYVELSRSAPRARVEELKSKFEGASAAIVWS